MSSFMLSSVFTITLCFLGFFISEAEFVYQVCQNETSYTANSPFQTNLKSLTSSLSSPNAPYDAGFYNTTAGQNPDRVFGIFFCRGDISGRICRDCVVAATNDSLTLCPFNREVAIWYDLCMVRYANRNIFSKMEADPIYTMYDNKSIETNRLDQFNQFYISKMNNLSDSASSAPAGSRKFSTGKDNFTALQTVYSLVECTPDLSASECSSCLDQAINLVKISKVGARFGAQSCNLRYEFYPFYDETSTTSVTPSSNPSKGADSGSVVTILAVVVPVCAAVVLFLIGYCILARRAKNNFSCAEEEDYADNDIKSIESLQFDLSTIELATDKFSDMNKLGEGGFGVVYKGQLPNGQLIAVKRLSKRSGQGVGEFKNEVVLVAKLQHRNLVRLLGFCVEGGEKLLVYEFVPNRSLDYFLFDTNKQVLLAWSTRYKIISGTARGILYLHQDSQLRIIHRDLKASNILLDLDMNPKVSDFGMARIFEVDQTQGNTSRIVGTYGYMAPEYAMQGKFSIKSDVYSFGVLVLEIVSGKRNISFYQPNGARDLITYAWNLWKEGKPIEFLDPILAGSYSKNEVIRCIHMGLLCVQEDPADRPTMATIVLMLNTYSVTLPMPQQPALFIRKKEVSNTTPKRLEMDPSMQWSIDQTQITEVYPR